MQGLHPEEADELIKTGIVTVNGQVITEMGYKVQPDDEVRFDGRKISSKNVYFVLNKPKGFISTSNDEGRKTVMDLMSTATTRIFPVGRLDRQTTGVLLFTGNDGYLTKKLTHPSHDVKIYHVTLDKKLTANDLADIKKGVRLIPEGLQLLTKFLLSKVDRKNEVGVGATLVGTALYVVFFETKGYEVEA